MPELANGGDIKTPSPKINISELRTIPQLARAFGVTNRQAEFAVESYRMEPTMRIARMRVFDKAAAARIESALRRTGAIHSGPNRHPVW